MSLPCGLVDFDELAKRGWRISIYFAGGVEVFCCHLQRPNEVAPVLGQAKSGHREAIKRAFQQAGIRWCDEEHLVEGSATGG